MLNKELIESLSKCDPDKKINLISCASPLQALYAPSVIVGHVDSVDILFKKQESWVLSDLLEAINPRSLTRIKNVFEREQIDSIEKLLLKKEKFRKRQIPCFGELTFGDLQEALHKFDLSLR